MNLPATVAIIVVALLCTVASMVAHEHLHAIAFLLIGWIAFEVLVATKITDALPN